MDTQSLLSFASHYLPEIAALLYVTGIALLLSSLWTRGRVERGQHEALASCQAEIAKATLENGALRSEIDRLGEELQRLSDRQAQIERRAPDARRFDHAMRIVRQGRTDAVALSDLGLNDGEARLLMRLHASEDEAAPRETAPQATAPSSAQGRALAQVMQA